uniref:Dynein light chain Tctex-type 1 n=1 Tax=Nomascus leucogenys TaxID=61853 RepID=A0A2I3G322_NOMLE
PWEYVLRSAGGKMEDYQAAEETAFVVDEVKAIESTIGGIAYQHSKVNQWTTNAVEQTSSQLTKLGKPLKYIVTCVIMQKNGAGLHMASSCFWDSSAARSCTVRWENKTMYCIVGTFGLCIGPPSPAYDLPLVVHLLTPAMN